MSSIIRSASFPQLHAIKPDEQAATVSEPWIAEALPQRNVVPALIHDFLSTGMRLFDRVEGRQVAAVALLSIAVLGIIGALHAAGLVHLKMFNLDREWTIPAFYSSALLFAASALALLLSQVDGYNTGNPVWWRFMGLFFAVMGLDEILSLHERLEKLTGIDWQVLYIPVVLIGGIGGLVTLKRLWQLRVGYLVYAGGAAAWFISQVFEKIEWSGHDGARLVNIYNQLMVAEEELEMIGSLLFGLGVLLALKYALRNRQPSSFASARCPSPSPGDGVESLSATML